MCAEGMGCGRMWGILFAAGIQTSRTPWITIMDCKFAINKSCPEGAFLSSRSQSSSNTQQYHHFQENKIIAATISQNHQFIAHERKFICPSLHQ